SPRNDISRFDTLAGSEAVVFRGRFMISLHEGKGSKIKKPAERAFTLRLNVVGCQPKIWRRLVVRESMWLSRLHDGIQVAFDWFDYQTHTFNFDDLRFGNPLKRAEV